MMPNKDIKNYASIGGKIRAERLTPSERSNSASIAARERWRKFRERQTHVCEALCVCANCGKLKYKHVTQESQKEFKCTSC